MTYNPTTGKVKLDSADKSDTVSFAKNAVSKELGEPWRGLTPVYKIECIGCCGSACARGHAA